MSIYELRFARLDRPKIARLRALEEQFGTWIVALQPPDPNSPLANLTAEQVQQLQETEKELGVLLLAYQPTAIEK